jgi:hypothetical protein
MPHDEQMPICKQMFSDNEKMHDTLWRKHDNLAAQFGDAQIENTREITAMKTKMLIYSAVGSIIGTGFVSLIVGIVLLFLRRQ